MLERDIVRYIDINEEFKKNSVSLGWHVKHGVISQNLTYLLIKKLVQDMAIFGKSGSGKTFFLARLIQELSQKAKDMGILVLNVAKQNQEVLYKGFQVVKYTDDDFRVPYFYKDNAVPVEKLMQETATYICASLGLKNVFEKIIYRTGIGFLLIKGELPETFIQFLKGVENYIKSNPYGPEEQANLLQIFRNRMNVYDEEKINSILKLGDDLPEWFSEWMNGGNIFLDLSMCSKFTKILVVNALFQLVRTLTRDQIYEKLKYLIVIDEAHAILEKPITNNSDDADFIVKEQMAKIFSELLKEYRSRGVGFILADQSPSSLFDDVVAQPSIRILFRQDYPNNLLFSEIPDDRQMLTQLPHRIALVLNGATGERLLIKSIENSY